MDVIRQITDLTNTHALVGADASGFGALQMLMLAGGVLGLGVVMRSTFRRVGRSRQQPRTSARRVYAGLTEETGARRDVERVMVELDQLARQIHGRIDTRFAKLEAVIRDADQRIDQLSRLLRETKGVPTLDLTVDGETPAGSRSPGAQPSSAPAPETNDTDSRHAAIYRLADSGLSADQIAERVSETVGEVELILALRRTKRDAARPAGLIGSSPPSASG